MDRNLFLLLGLLTAGYLSDAYNILVVFPLPGKSHSILGEGVVRHLLNAGHEVTYITPFLINNNHSKLHQIDMSDHSSLIIPHRTIMESVMKKQIQLSDHRFVMEITRVPYINTLEHPIVQKLLNDTNQTFDAVIVEWMFGELLAGWYTQLMLNTNLRSHRRRRARPSQRSLTYPF
ncbi:hypothetical protein K1T71_012108 [Dendrolimus kikuchii]|uniref:Uncharacterized protein n=1 Tax=Dendrolimus kikuchii TaxID=765133 RepID=A0ACC1CKV3_9NEOP|nr:hypothetical protein K1T71_012108 [Dendrolimus kikuchii]